MQLKNSEMPVQIIFGYFSGQIWALIHKENNLQISNDFYIITIRELATYYCTQAINDLINFFWFYFT